MGDESRRAFLPSPLTCMWEIDALEPGALVVASVSWAYLGISSACSNASAALFAYNGSELTPDASLCWKEPNATITLNGTGMLTLVLEVTAAHTAYGFGLSWQIFRFGGNTTGSPNTTETSSATATSSTTSTPTASGASASSASSTPAPRVAPGAAPEPAGSRGCRRRARRWVRRKPR